jgi:hypothetical protein
MRDLSDSLDSKHLMFCTALALTLAGCGKAEFSSQNVDSRNSANSPNTSRSQGAGGASANVQKVSAATSAPKDGSTNVAAFTDADSEAGNQSAPNTPDGNPWDKLGGLVPSILGGPFGSPIKNLGNLPRPGSYGGPSANVPKILDQPGANTPIGGLPPTMNIKINVSVDTKITTTTTTNTTNTTTTTVTVKPCSTNYLVPATANPYFAGSPVGSALDYIITPYDPQTPTDRVAQNAPILVSPIGDCLKVGAPIYFSVGGAITFSNVDAPTDANGSLDKIVSHQKGATFGKSDITAPINSLIGVFLGEGDPAGLLAPSPLDFSTQAARDYFTLNPTLGQTFFIGNGRTSTGEYHRVIVPQGATRLYFAVMDIYQWNNNSGSLRGAIMTE